MFVHLLIGLLLASVLLAAGGAVALTWQPAPDANDTPLHHVLLALGWAFGLIPFIAFAIALIGRVALVAWMPLSVAALVAASALLFWSRRQHHKLPSQLRQGWGEARWVLLAATAVGLIYLLKYDRSVFFLESCIHRVVMQTLRLTDSPIDILASNADDQRLGNTAIISTFVGLFRGLGFRLLYAFVGFATALGGFLLGRRALGSSAFGGFVLVLLPLNPWVAKVPLLDENLLTLGFSSLFLPLLLRKRVPWAHVGALFGLVVMMRHVAILSAPALVWAVWAWRHGDRRRAFLSGFLAFNAVTFVAHLHHYIALGSLLKFESFGQIPAFPHRFVGDYSGLLQWPFADHVLRTPWNPLPTFLMWPVYMADHMGLVLFAAMGVGAVWLLKKRRPEGVFWLLWLALPYTALSVQENWDVPNKMGVIYTLFHPFVVFAAAGLYAAAKNPRRYGTAAIGLALLSGFGIHAARTLHIPADTRYYQAWPGEREEDPAYVRASLLDITDVAPWPDYTRLGPLDRVFNPQKLTGLLHDLKHPELNPVGTPYGWFPGESTDPSAAPVTIELDLRARLFDAAGPVIRRADANAVPVVDLSVDGPPVIIPNLRVSWTPRPVTLLLSRGNAPVTGLNLIFEAFGDNAERRAYLQERYHRGLMMVLGWSEGALAEARVVRTTTTQKTDNQGHTVDITSNRIILRVPAGPLSLVESVNNAGQNYLHWRARLSANRPVELEGPLQVFHN